MNLELPNIDLSKKRSYAKSSMEAPRLSLVESEKAVKDLEDALERAFEELSENKVDEIYAKVKRNNEVGRAVEH